MMAIILFVPQVLLPHLFQIVHIKPTQMTQQAEMIAAIIFKIPFEP